MCLWKLFLFTFFQREEKTIGSSNKLPTHVEIYQLDAYLKNKTENSEIRIGRVETNGKPSESSQYMASNCTHKEKNWCFEFHLKKENWNALSKEFNLKGQYGSPIGYKLKAYTRWNENFSFHPLFFGPTKNLMTVHPELFLHFWSRARQLYFENSLTRI